MNGPRIELWYEALSRPLGLIIRTDNPDLFRQKMYRIRAEAKDPDLDCLSILIAPDSPRDHVWIIKQDEAKRRLSPPEGDTQPS